MRYGIDAVTALRLIDDGVEVPASVQLVGAAALRSQVLALLYAEVRAGTRTESQAKAALERLAALKVRLLGDRVSRATAWKVARELDWADTVDAEPVAVTRLQADAFVTVDEAYARRIGDAVPLAPYSVLTAA